MLRKGLFWVCILFSSTFILAREHPKIELFGGYAFQRSLDFNLHGWNASIMAPINHWFALGADFSATHDRVHMAGLDVGMSMYSAMFGPQFSHRTERIMAFSHVLVGGHHALAAIEPVIQRARARMALMVGGGMDISLGKRIAVRIFQVDYHSAWGSGGRNEALRVSGGLVIKIE